MHIKHLAQGLVWGKGLRRAVVIIISLTASWRGSDPLLPSSGLALFLLCQVHPPPPHSLYSIPLSGSQHSPLPGLRGNNQTIRQEPTEGDDWGLRKAVGRGRRGVEGCHPRGQRMSHSRSERQTCTSEPGALEGNHGLFRVPGQRREVKTQCPP